MTAPSEQKNQHFIDAAVRSGVDLPLCDEYEKMISGMPFLPHTSPELQEAKLRVKKLLVKYNDPAIGEDETLDDIKAKRRDLARKLFRSVGDSSFEAPLFTSYGFNTTIGDNCYGNLGIQIFDSAPVTIGDYVWIAPNVTIITDNHSIDPWERREKSILFARPVTIESDCWIGCGAQIMPGVTIHRGCTIGAGAVVTKDVPEYSLAVGVPARVIRNLRKERLEDGGDTPVEDPGESESSPKKRHGNKASSSTKSSKKTPRNGSPRGKGGK